MKIKARYAALPIIDTSLRYVVQIDEPLALIPRVVSLGYQLLTIRPVPVDALKLLELHLKNEFGSQDHEIELVACDLLTPRNEAS